MLEEPTSLRIDDPGVRALFTEAARFQSWLDVEAALARAQAELGIIPEAVAREIVRKAHLSFLDLAAVREGLARTGHPLVPLVWELDRACEGDAGGFVHWGATTQNVTQTGQLLQVRRAHEIFLRQLATILTTLADLASAPATCCCPAAPTASTRCPPPSGSRSRCGSTSWDGTWSACRPARGGCSWPCWAAGREPWPRWASSGSRPRSGWRPTSGWPRCRCPRAPSATIRRSTSRCWACSPPPAARSAARSTPS